MPHALHSTAHQLLIARLRQARKAAGLRQAQVAARLGVPQSFVAKVEGGERRLDVIDFVRIAQAIEVDPATLIMQLVQMLAEGETLKPKPSGHDPTTT